MYSFSGRLLIAASVVLTSFLALTGLTLDRAFRDSAQAAVQGRLQSQIYMLLGAVDVDALRRLTITEPLPEVRFATPDSGVYADVMDAQGNLVWRSASLLGRNLPFFPAVRNIGETQFAALQSAQGDELFVLALTVSWEVSPNQHLLYTFRVAEAQSNYLEQLWSFRHSLWGWLVAATVVLLAVQGLILRWSLRPLRRVAAEVTEIETGQRSALSSYYPRELQPLTTNLNALVRQGRSALERYRNALGDLAHSLKTPLAVLRNTLDTDRSAPEPLRAALLEQVERMNRTVDYQLQRAAAAGPVALSKPHRVDLLATRILDSLNKVYAERHLALRSEIAPDALFYGDAGDFMEILGNLADNACKWARTQIVVRAWAQSDSQPAELFIEVEDDGPGIADAQIPLLCSRGQRADPTVAGYGIGLAVVRDLVEEVYHGHLRIERGQLGGARLRATLRFRVPGTADLVGI